MKIIFLRDSSMLLAYLQVSVSIVFLCSDHERFVSELSKGNSVTVVRPASLVFVSNLLHLEKRGRENSP